MQEKKEISQKIVDYAIWYYLRYFPSVNKVRQKLREKFGPQSEKGKKY
jgi:transposase-like protein